MNAQEFYNLAKAEHACAQGLSFVRRAAFKVNSDISLVPVSVVFDAMLEDAKSDKSRREQTYSGNGYLRWAFANLLDWPRRWEGRLLIAGIVSPILAEAGCQCKAADRYGYFGADMATPSDLYTHLRTDDNCAAAKHLKQLKSECDHLVYTGRPDAYQCARIDLALAVHHKALTRAFE